MSARVDARPRLTLGALLCLVLACASKGDTAEAEVSHDEVAALVGAKSAGAPGSCGVASCHGSAAEAGLQFEPGKDLRSALVGVRACEAPELNLVEPGVPERSWLWIKLTATMSSSVTGDLKADPAWGAAGKNCGANGFGKRMPRVSPYSLSTDELDTIRAWIEAGAPGLTSN